MSQSEPGAQSGMIRLGSSYVLWGLRLGIFGLILEFGIIGHYIIGANHSTGEQFLKNVTLWFACPWTLAVYTIQIGGLAMVVYGGLFLVLGKVFPEAQAGAAAHAGRWFCIIGLLGIFCFGYV